MPRAARGRATRSTRSPATFTLDGHLIETYNHIDDLPQLSSLPKKRPRHATRGATAAERRADRQAATTSDPQQNGIVTRSSRQNLLRPSNSTSALTAPSPSSEPPESEHPPISCRVCLKSNTATKIICCSICRKGIHTFCLNPPVMDLPNDASWKCIKCRQAHIPLKKEARIILRDALNTYSTLCTDNYINAVANVVCVVSDSESADQKKSGKTSIKANGHLEPSRGRPNDNTVILRVSTDDSDLDSDVDDDIQPNPIVNPGKPKPTRLPERSDTNHHLVRDTNPAPHPQTSRPSRKELAKPEPLPSSPSSIDVDDERPLSQLMSRGAQRRHRHVTALNQKNIDPVHASPKLRLKAKQRLMREEYTDGLSRLPADPKPSRDPRNLPPKRRGRKPPSRRTEKDAHDNAKPMDADCEKESTGPKGDEARQIGNGGHNNRCKTPPTTTPNRKEVKRESNVEEINESHVPEKYEENRPATDTRTDLPNAFASNVDEGYPGDTEDDLPLSKRSARYRRLSISGRDKENKDKSAPEQGGEHESREKPLTEHDQGSYEGKRLQEPKKEAFTNEATGCINDRPAETPGGDDLTPSASNQPLRTNPAAETKSPEKWAQIKLDPKREALFALARVQRQRAKPGDSSGRLATSLDGECSGRFSKLMSRTKNVPESERQRIQVTALAASNMRRNVSNMASTMAGLRPHSPRVSKGSINLLLQQNQPETRGGVAPQRSYAELPVQDVAASGHESNRDRDSGLPNNTRLHLHEGESGKLSTGMFPPSANPRRQDGSSSARPYVNPTGSGATAAYSIPQQQNVGRSGILSSIEPEAQPYGTHSRDSEMLPLAKRHRSNKSDLRNMLSNDNIISVEENRNLQRGDPRARVYPEADRQILQQSAAGHNTMRGHPSSRTDPYSFSHRLPHSRFEASGVPANIQESGATGRQRLSLPQGPMRSIDDRSSRTRHVPGGLPYPGMSYRNSGSQVEPKGRLSREEDDRIIDRRTQASSSTHRGHGSDLRTTSQLFSSPNPAGNSLPAGLRWRDSKNLGATAVRRDYASASTANQPWSDSRTDHRSTLHESSYEVPVNRFVPIDRRTRRPMPYVPTATRKAQFEQGRALAFFDSRPAPPGTEPSDAFRIDDGASRMTPRAYSAHQEGLYPSPNDYSYPTGGQSRTNYPNLESQPHATLYRGDYCQHHRDYVGGSNDHRIDERDPFLRDSHRGAAQRERVGNEIKTGSGNLFGKSRPGALHPTQKSSGAPLEPPIDAQKGLSMERTEAPPLGPLVDARARSHQDKNIPRITNTLESERRLPEKRVRLTTGPGPDERVYNATNRIGNSTRRSPEFADRSYGSYQSGRNRNEAIRGPVGSLMEARIPIPVHVDTGHHRSRDTLGRQTGRNFAPNVVSTSGSMRLYNQANNQTSGSYGYARSDTEGRRSMMPQRGTNLEGRNEDFGADRVSNIPLVARFDNSVTGYIDRNAATRSSDGGSRVGERSMNQRNDQREQLPSLRSNPSLRDLLS